MKYPFKQCLNSFETPLKSDIPYLANMLDYRKMYRNIAFQEF